MAAEADPSVTPYRQIAADLRRKIVDGDLGPDDKLPSARELMETYGVATQTVQNAFRLLRAEDLIYSIQGRGTFVRADLDPTALPGGEEPSAAYLQVLDQLTAMGEEIQHLGRRVDELEAARDQAQGS